MRAGKSVTVSSAEARRLKALVKDRNAPQKHVWRAKIVLLTADGVGTNEIIGQTGKSKTCVWRWQERFMEEGFEGLLRQHRLGVNAQSGPSSYKPTVAAALHRALG
jgi:Homeodomain-like domain